MLIDTHCHIHSDDYPLDKEEVLRNAYEDGVEKIICIGTSLSDSEIAVDFANRHDGVYATVGVHPHGEGAEDVSVNITADGLKDIAARQKVVAIGEIGLDYHYKPYDREAQIRLFEEQLQLATEVNMPVVFHIREAFEDAMAVIANFSGVGGALHSFTGTDTELKKGLGIGLFVSLNGIATFSKDEAQLRTFDKIPLNKLLLETDSPYLTPKRFRGTMNEPQYVGEVARWVAERRGITLDEVAKTTSDNATRLFNL